MEKEINEILEQAIMTRVLTRTSCRRVARTLALIRYMKEKLCQATFSMLLVFGSINIGNGQCIANAGNNATLCTFYRLDTFYLGGTPTVIGGIAPYIYNWTCNYSNIWFSYTASDFLDDTTSSNPRLIEFADTSLTFYLEVTDSSGSTCTDSINIQFSIFVITLDVKHAHIHQGDSAQLYTSVHEGIPPLTYLWSPSIGLTDSTDVFTWAKPDTTTTYYLLVADSAGCQIEDVFYVFVEPTSGSEIPYSHTRSIFAPNPFSDVAFLSVVPFESISHYECNIYDLTGRLKKKVTIPREGAEIGRPEFEPGIYFYQILEDAKVICQDKFVVQ